MKIDLRRRRNTNRGTLTFTRTGEIILGIPKEVTQAQAAEIAERLTAWQEDQLRALVFPWPIEVVDQREPPSNEPCPTSGCGKRHEGCCCHSGDRALAEAAA